MVQDKSGSLGNDDLQTLTASLKSLGAGKEAAVK